MPEATPQGRHPEAWTSGAACGSAASARYLLSEPLCRSRQPMAPCFRRSWRHAGRGFPYLTARQSRNASQESVVALSISVGCSGSSKSYSSLRSCHSAQSKSDSAMSCSCFDLPRSPAIGASHRRRTRSLPKTAGHRRRHEEDRDPRRASEGPQQNDIGAVDHELSESRLSVPSGQFIKAIWIGPMLEAGAQT